MQEAVQGGFDQGYAVGAAAGWEAGLLYGGAAAARAALAASHERPEAMRTAEIAHPGTAAANSNLEDGTSELSVQSPAGGVGVASGGSGRVAAPALTGGNSTGSPQSRVKESGVKDSAATGAEDSLQGLVEELRHAIMLGPDGPGAPAKAEVLRRLRLAGPAGEAVADGLDEKSSKSCPIQTLGAVSAVP